MLGFKFYMISKDVYDIRVKVVTYTMRHGSKPAA